MQLHESFRRYSTLSILSITVMQTHLGHARALFALYLLSCTAICMLLQQDQDAVCTHRGSHGSGSMHHHLRPHTACCLLYPHEQSETS